MQDSVATAIATPQIADFTRAFRSAPSTMIDVGHSRVAYYRFGEGLIGSTAETLLHEAPCQVLVVKHKATVDAEPEGQRRPRRLSANSNTRSAPAH